MLETGERIDNGIGRHLEGWGWPSNGLGKSREEARKFYKDGDSVVARDGFAGND
jgi:hypothetical protein